ncbi:MAG: hypothetical protein M3209_04650 [Acidobacteriota bacterium]|nr:hypothetical protein [Acidobacteriota bacterium]
MHNCQNTKEELFDLLFGETDAVQTARLQRELRFCDACSTEYAGMQKTFAEYEKFSALDVPEENYWRSYEMRLNEKLMSVEAKAQKKSFAASFYRKFLSAQIRVPVPVAAAFVVLFAGTAFFGIRFSAGGVQPIQTVSEPQIVPVEKVVVQEKEVWRDRVVTQKIYVQQRERKIKNQAQASFAARQKRDFQPAEAKVPILNLAEFQPPSKVEPKIIAGSNYDEK